MKPNETAANKIKLISEYLKNKDKNDNFLKFESIREKHNLDEADKHGFPINKNGEQVSLFDKNGNAVLLLNNTILVKFPKGYASQFTNRLKGDSLVKGSYSSALQTDVTPSLFDRVIVCSFFVLILDIF